jgi:hypothetical protein
VKATWHVPDDKVQLAPTVPTAVFDDVKVTEPVGVFDRDVVSATVAVQVEAPPGTTVAGLQATPVDVLSLLVTLTVIDATALTLPL